MSAGELAPSLGIIEANWERNENQTASTSNDGESDVLEFADPLWTIKVKVTITSRDQFDEWDSFFARRQLAVNSFTMWRSLRVRPRDQLITSDAGLALSGINAGASTISLTGYGIGRKASFGDMIGYRTAANGHWVGQVVQEATADGAGAITASVWPRPVAPHATTPAPRRFKALGEFRMIKAPDPNEAWMDWDYRFEAEQVLR